MLPGKKYKPEDFVQVAWTRKWYILVPALLIALATATVAYLLPDKYRSSTTILVVPQRVPESYVRSTVTTSVAERLQTISQQILSRTRLERLIEEFNLYPKERQAMIMEDVVELMRRRDIILSVVSGRGDGTTSHFSVSFDAPSPRTAMQVTERLASMFVQENLQDREVLADSTNQFLQAQLQDAKRRLQEHEGKLKEFNLRNAGQLPAQMQSNLSMMQITQSQLQDSNAAILRDRDSLAVLDAAIAEAVTAMEQSPRAGGDVPAPQTAAAQLEAARIVLANQEKFLKPSHPDIGRLRRQVAQLEAQVAAERGANPSVAAAVIPEKLQNMRLEAEKLRVSLATKEAESARLKSVLGSYGVRLEAMPALESELTELMRDYNTLNEQYQNLLRKSEDSKIAVNLERRQIGEQFKVIDGARLPERPVSPNRPQINLMGLLGGLAFGVALVALLEYRDTTLKTDDDVVTSLALPVVAVIPAMMTAADRLRLKRRRRLVGVSMSVAAVLAAVAVAAWQFQWLDRWVR